MNKPVRITQFDPTYCVTCNKSLPDRASALRHSMHGHLVTSAERGGHIRNMLAEMRDHAPRSVSERST